MDTEEKMAKKGGKDGGQPQAPKMEVSLRKEKEEKSIKGKWVSLIATLKENGKPVVGKMISFFCGDENIGNERTDADGEARNLHLLRKSGTHAITAMYDAVRSSAVTMEILQKAESIVIRSWHKNKGAGVYLVAIQVLDKNKPIPNTILRFGTQRVFVDLEPTDPHGMVFFKITVPRDLVFMVVHESSASIPIAFFKKQIQKEKSDVKTQPA